MANVKQRESVRDLVSPEEWAVRVDLAAAYRIVAMHGWDDLVFTHISARVPDTHHFLINPYGFLFEEITASSLVKIDLSGNKILDTPYDINPAGFTIHAAIHEAREDVHCVMHLHTDAGVAVSCQAHGLLPLCQNALFPHSSLAYHDYEGIALNSDEKIRLIADLGSKNFMILRNHGTLTTGATVADAYLYMYFLERSCRIQISALSGGGALVPVPSAVIDGFQAQITEVTKSLGGQLAWPGLLRKLDRQNPSFRT